MTLSTPLHRSLLRRSSIALALGVGAALAFAHASSSDEEGTANPAAEAAPGARVARPAPTPPSAAGSQEPTRATAPTLQGAVPKVPDGDPYDSSSPAYDPVKLAQRDDLVAREIFEREERVPAFADRRESFLHDKAQELLESLEFEATLHEVECRTSSCQLVAQSPDAALEDFYEDMQGAVWGMVFQPSLVVVDGQEAVKLTILFDPRTRDHDFYESSVFDFR